MQNLIFKIQSSESYADSLGMNYINIHGEECGLDSALEDALYGVQQVGVPPYGHFTVNGKLPMADIFAYGSNKCVSQRVKDILDTFEVPNHYYPIKFIRKNKSAPKHLNYYMMGLGSQEIDCIDITQTTALYRDRETREQKSFCFGDGIPPPSRINLNEYTKIVLNEDALKGHHMCKPQLLIQRVRFPVLTIISTELACAFRKESITGADYYYPEEFPERYHIRNKRIEKMPLDCSCLD
ncbi:MAG: DUF1629 domain-containing protein [Pseudomonadota bacterium]